MKFYFDDFEFDLEKAELRRAGALTKAEPVVLRQLEVLVRAEGKLVTKEELLAQVWDGRAVAENVITVAMVRLRKTLGHTPGEREFVNNVHGRGYRFVCPVTQQPPPADAPRAIRRSRPFVGRERLLNALAGALADADAGHGNACVLTGVPGIGKTRVLEEFERQVNAAGMFMAWGHCRESEDTPPLWPFAQILRHLHAWSAKRNPSAEPAEWAAEFPELAMLLPELWQRRAVQATDAKNSEPEGRLAKHQVFDAIIRLLTRASEQQTCVLVLDDLQRADAASLELLRSWIDRLPRTRILLLAAFPRVDHARTAARAHLAYVYGHRNTTRLTLDPLIEADVASYVSALIEDPSSELAHAVFVKSEGNPFFMNELVRQLRDSEHATSDLAVPEAALELVRRRLAILMSHWLAAALLFTAGCAHSEMRCDRRSDKARVVQAEEQPPWAYPHWAERRRKALARVKDLYDKGIRSFEAKGRERGGSAFTSIVGQLMHFEGGELLFEQLDDGTWAYRCDELTKLFALAAYRLAIIGAEGGGESAGADHFCLALESRPDLVLALVQREGLGSKARATFEKMKRDGHPILGQCYDEHGWRHEGQDPPSWGLGGNCPPDQPECPR